MSNAVPSLLLALAISAAGPSWTGGGPLLLAASEPGTVHDTVRLTVDFARLIQLKRPASTVILGNTAIASANLSDDRTLVLTGRTVGATNLIVLDAGGEEIANYVVEVAAAGAHLVTVHRGESRQTYACIRRCDPVLSVGDDPERFNATASQITIRQGFAEGGAAGQ